MPAAKTKKQEAATEKQEIVDSAIQPVNPNADVHHMVRRISEHPIEDTFSGDEVNAHVLAWLQAGYRLEHIQSVGLEAGKVINVFYVFVKYE